MLLKLKGIYNKLIEIKMEKVQFSKAKITYMTCHKLETNDLENIIYSPKMLMIKTNWENFNLKYYMDYISGNKHRDVQDKID